MLQVTNLVKHFDGVKAVNGVSFDIGFNNKGGECVALIGPNGAGKSTCFACIAGQHVPTSGDIVWCGTSIAGWSAARRQQSGIARTFQVAQTFEALTVLQNVQLILANARGLSTWRDLSATDVEAAMRQLAEVALAHLAQADVLGLPYGAKKRLELALALAGIAQSNQKSKDSKRLLLLDEPAAGLAGPERADLMRLVKSVASRGIAVLYTEHNMDAVFGVADRVLVLIDGQLAAQGTPDEIAQNPVVRNRYLGRSFNTQTERLPSQRPPEATSHA